MNLFSSLKILDLTRVFSGPFATRHFSDFGAEVIKIEPPQGDDSRHFPPQVNGWSGYFETLNHNKKSLVLDLKNKNDLKRFYSLCKECDVLVENFSPKIKKKLSINYSKIKKLNPRIIYASVSGVSEKVNKRYYDVIAQAESGLISLNGEKADMKIATSITDAFSGMKLAFAISSALYSRCVTNQGCQLNVSMKGSTFDLLEQNLITSSITKKNPKKVGNMDNVVAPFGVFKTKGGAIVLAIGNDGQWQKFEHFLIENNPKYEGSPFNSNEKRIRNIKLLKKEIEKVLKQFKAKDVIKNLSKLNIPCGQVKTMLDVIDDRENFKQKLLDKIKHPVAGQIIIPTGGINYSAFKKEKYQPAPKLNNDKDYGI